MDFPTDRRQFLQLAGTGAALSFAGCGSSQSNNGQTGTDAIETGPTTAQQTDNQQTTTGIQDGSQSTATVALAIQVDQEALRTRQSELQRKLQNGTINRTQAQQQFSSFRTNLIADAIETFRNRVQDDPSMTIEDSVPQLGVLLIAGTVESLINTLPNEEVRALFPQTTFQQAKVQAQTGGS